MKYQETIYTLAGEINFFIFETAVNCPRDTKNSWLCNFSAKARSSVFNQILVT